MVTELEWTIHLSTELDIEVASPMKLKSDNLELMMDPM